jgi:arylsulfatase A-like enzyme
MSRTSLQTKAAIAIMAAVVSFWAPRHVRPARAAVSGRPNILVILTDDQRADSMVMMPKTSKWFRDSGTEFPNVFDNTPMCAPMRASLMSGRYQHNHGVTTNLNGPENLDQSATVQKYLHDAGYQTALDGKLLINWVIPKAPPNFDHFANFNGGYTGVRWNVDGKVSTPKQYVTDFQSDRAIDFLNDFQQDRSRPWYLYVSTQAPHAPYTPAPKYAKAPLPPYQPDPPVTADRSSKPDFIRRQNYSMAEARKVRDGQLRTLLSVDDMVDRIFQRLQESGQLDNTLAVYTSDDAWMYGDFGLHSKGTPYNNAMHVPFFVRGAGHLPAGTSDPRLVSPLDLTASVVDVSGLTPALKYPIDGRSVFQPSSRPEALLEYHYSPDFTSVPSWASIRSPSFQYIEWYNDEAGSSLRVREYYDVAKDPWQLDNLLGDGNPAHAPPEATLAELAARLARYRTCQGTTGPAACP